MEDNQNGISAAPDARRNRPRIDRSERSDSREETGRSARVPLGVSRPKLAVPQRQGYVRRWVNDVEGRLGSAEQGGYQFVENKNFQIGAQDIDNENRDLGARVSRVVDKSTGMKAYLMEIPKEYHEEDQRIKMREVDETESAIKRGALDNNESRYVPKDGIKINRT